MAEPDWIHHTAATSVQWPEQLGSTQLASLAGAGSTPPSQVSASFPNDGFYSSYSRQWHVDRVWAPQAWETAIGSKQARGGWPREAVGACSGRGALEPTAQQCWLKVHGWLFCRWASA